jgi:hypothetical protein
VTGDNVKFENLEVEERSNPNAALCARLLFSRAHPRTLPELRTYVRTYVVLNVRSNTRTFVRTTDTTHVLIDYIDLSTTLRVARSATSSTDDERDEIL